MKALHCNANEILCTIGQKHSLQDSEEFLMNKKDYDSAYNLNNILTDETENTLFGKYISAELEKLTPIGSARAKIHIQQVLFKCKFES